MKTKILLILSLFCFSLSCKKGEFQSIQDLALTQNKENIHQLKAGYITTPFFDWENETYINYQGQNILLPWASGANSDIPIEIKPDFKQSEGWRLLYNTFPNSGESDPVLILYNAYRGIVRAYFFITSSSYTNNMFTWGCGAGTVGSAYTSAFNFSWSLPKPMDTRKPNPHIFKANWCSDPNILPNGIVPGYWYFCEFELAYDSNIPNLNHDEIELQFRGFASQKASIVLNGKINGTIKGTFDMPKSSATGGLLSSFADFPLLSTPKDSSKITLITGQNIANFLLNKISGQTNTTLKNLLTTGLNSLIGGSLNVSNPILKILTNSIFSPSSSSNGQMNLSLSASTSSTGVISSSFPGPSKPFYFPGSQLSSNKGGLLPNYNYNLGVWNIDQTPVVKYSRASITRAVRKTDPEIVSQTFTLDANSFNIVINPTVTGLENATITSQKKELILYKRLGDKVSYVVGELINSEKDNFVYKATTTYIIPIYSGPPLGKDNTFNYHTVFGNFLVRVTIALRPAGSEQDIILVKEFPVKFGTSPS
jgi:hypothetical protein